MSDKQNRVYLADIVGEEQAAGAAALLRESGADVSRDSRARWFVSRRDPRVLAWLAYRADERTAMDGAAESAARYGY